VKLKRWEEIDVIDKERERRGRIVRELSDRERKKEK
jgi:hypothetical protein